MTRKLKVRLKWFECKPQDPSGFTIPPIFTVGVNCFVTIVATQLLQFGAVFANILSYFLFTVVVSLATIVVVVVTAVVVVSSFLISSKMAVFNVSRKCDVTNRNFEI